MATTYLELKKKAEKMLAEAEQMRQKEIDDVIADIRGKMKSYGLSAQDLGFGGGGGGAAKRKSGPRTKGTVKYRGPNGESWGGGRGRKPQWVVNALKSGKKIEDFAV